MKFHHLVWVALAGSTAAVAPAHAVTYTAICAGQTVSASSLAAFGPKCTIVNPAPAAAAAPTAPTKPPAPAFNPYKNLLTVQGWANAYRQYGAGSAGSPYYAAAVNKQTVYDANGNFLTARSLGATTKIGSTTYVMSASVSVNGVTVYTYIKK